MAHVMYTGSTTRGLGLGIIICSLLFAWMSIKYPVSEQATEFQDADATVAVSEDLVAETLESSIVTETVGAEAEPPAEPSPAADDNSIGALAELAELSSPDAGTESAGAVNLESSSDPVPEARSAVQPETGESVATDAPAIEAEPASVPEVADISLDNTSGELEPVAGVSSLGEETDTPGSREVAVIETDISGETDSTVETESAAQVPLPELREGMAYQVNAIPFEDNPRMPLVALVVQDDGDGSLNVNDLVSLGIPLNITVPLDRQDATGLAEMISEIGFEILAELSTATIAGISGGDSESIARVVLAVPNAVGLVDAGGLDDAGRVDLVNPILSYASESGHALIFDPNRGSRQLQSGASSLGLPGQKANRTVDEIPDEARIKRALEFAKVRARSAPVILFATDAPVTMQFIREWLQSPSAALVQFGPVSAVMARQF